MIAAETTRTAAIIFPYRCVVKCNVADGAHLSTLAAVDADVGIDGELLVGYHKAVEVGTDDVAERPGRQSERQLRVARLPFGDDALEVGQPAAGLILLLTLAFGCVGIHKRQTNVALGHRQRLTAVEHDVLCAQLVGQHLHRQSRTVATRTQGVRVVPPSVVDA